MNHRNQKGVAHLMFVLLLVLVAAIAFASYKVVKDRQNKTDASVTSTAIAKPVSTQPIKSTADLNSAASDLNDQAVDSDLNPDQLNSDVSSLL